MQVCTSLQTGNPTTQFLQAGCPSCRPTNSIKALTLILDDGDFSFTSVLAVYLSKLVISNCACTELALTDISDNPSVSRGVIQERPQDFG